jgi:tripartite-type tricarboxylate transporter receptor subunit TctC
MECALNRSWIIGLTLSASLGSQDLCGQTLSTGAEVFPAKPIRWIVPYPPGGPADLVARIIGRALGERLKQPVLVENRAGAFANIGMEAAARAAPDGYTLAFGATSMVLNPLLYKLTFDPLTELTPISQLVNVRYVLLASSTFPPRTVQELLAAARARPGTITCGWGATLFQLGCELLRVQGQAEISSVPYKGNAPAMNDLVGGHVNLLFDPVNTALPQVRAGRVRAIATASTKRGTGPFSDLPTVNETLPGFEMPGWFGALAPAATPREVIARLNREFAEVLEEDEVRRRLSESGLEIAYGSPEAFGEMIRRTHASYSKIIREAGIKAE